MENKPYYFGADIGPLKQKVDVLATKQRHKMGRIVEALAEFWVSLDDETRNAIYSGKLGLNLDDLIAQKVIQYLESLNPEDILTLNRGREATKQKLGRKK